MDFNLYNLQSMLQDYLFRRGLADEYKSLSRCGSGVIPTKGENPAIFLLATDDHTDATFFGHMRCKNSWACPVCSARNMQKHAIRIAAAIDALKAQNQIPIMITFTVLHNRFMSCKETTDILYTAWKLFIHRGNKKSGRNDAYSNFREDCGSVHQVRVAEVTYGEHGWHPHFHCIFWIDSDKLATASKYEKQLRERWDDCVNQATLKMWRLYRPELADKTACRKLLRLRRHANSESKGLFISRDKTGAVIVQQSSTYITGWSAEKELTGMNYKTARAGHYTPLQLLELAYRLPAGSQRDSYLALYVEFIQAVTGSSFHARINYSSHSGINGIINCWLELFGDKYHCETKKLWHVVCTFTPELWNIITYMNKFVPMKQHLLELSVLPDARNLITFYLSLYDIRCPVNSHNLESVVESIFNRAA